MKDYYTTQEASQKWGITSRYIQMLCKNGKIKDAIKKGGIWFIPTNTPSPNETKKKGIFKNSTKNAIFDISIELFAQYQFDAVSIKDIASKIGRNQATIYNHFTSKQDILDHIYDYFCEYFIIDRPSIEEIEPILVNGSLFDIIDSVFYIFKSEHVERLLLVMNIIQQRQFTDERAKQIAYDIMIQSGINFAKEVFDRAVELGRLAPFDTYMLSLFCNYIRQGTHNSMVLQPSKERHSSLLQEEDRFKKYAMSFLTDLHAEKSSK